jgi:hypothetical protein
MESEHEEEPNLQTLVNRLFGYGTVIDNSQEPDYINNGSTPVLYGEEVASGLWQAANPNQAVTVRQLFAFHNEQDLNNGQSPAATIFWFPQSNSSTLHPILQHAPGHSQSLLPPLINTTSTPASGSFNTTGVFGFNLDGESSVDSQNTADMTGFARSGHSVRFYPLRDSQGNLIPNTWLVAMDYQNGSFDNSDFQDNGYIVTNMRPVTQAPAPTNLQAVASGSQVNLSWNAVSDGSLQGYNVYSSTSPTGPFTKLNSSPVSGTTFTDNSPAGSTTYYQVSAVDSAGESEKADASTAVSSTTGGGGTGGNTGGSTDGPDLTLSPLTFHGKTSVVGKAASGPFRVTVTNNGNQTAKGTVRIDLYLSPTQDAVPSGATSLQHVMRAINLKAGKSVTLALPGFRYPSDVSAQDFVVAQLTDVKGITESNTSNNTGSTASAITIAPPFIDLQNLFTGSLPATFVSGKHSALVVPVINNGNVAAHGIATVTITASTSQSGSNGQTIATVKRAILAGPGKTQKINVHLLVPSLSSGNYFVVTDVELAGDTVASNNLAVSTGTFST